ncbi:MAG: CvpA family protein [Thermomicrobiales bacterium]
MFNWVDYAILLSFMVIVGFGFFGGIAKVSAAIISIYASSILAAAFYRPTTNALQRVFSNLGQTLGELITFVVLFLVFSAVLTMIVARWFTGVRLPRRFLLVDNIGGVVLGLVLSAMALTFAALFLTVVLQALNQTVSLTGSDSVLGFARSQIRESELVPLFLRLAPLVSHAVSPWFPSGLPPIIDGAS